MRMMKKLDSKNIRTLIVLFSILLIGALFIFKCAPNRLHYLQKSSRSIHQKYWQSNPFFYQYLMEGTPQQTPIFCFNSNQEGSTVLIIGGTHGDEIAGFEAAHRLLDQLSKSGLKSGKIFLIPEANKIAVINKKRRIPVPQNVNKEKGNLNRCYPGNPNGLPLEKEAYEIAELIRNQNIDLLLDLHESKKLHLSVKDEEGVYSGLGQTLIYTLNDEAAWLGMVVLDELNSKIQSPEIQFSLVERPIKNSAAWMAGELFKIPGFTIETYRGLPLEERIQYQLQIVNIILREKGLL